MGKYKYTDEELKLNTLIAYQDQRLNHLKSQRTDALDQMIKDSESLLKELGYDPNMAEKHPAVENEVKELHIPSWNDLYDEAKSFVGGDVCLEELFSEDELIENEVAIHQLNNEYNQIHKLDKIDYAIAVGAGMLGAVVDILLVGLPENPAREIEAKPLSAWVKNYFDNKYTPEIIKGLEKNSKVPYDAAMNHYKDNFLEKEVDGLTPYFHRLLSLGHDPLLGFVVGVRDIIKGNMTTIDKAGRFVSQNMNGFLKYEERQVTDILKAITLQFNHLKSDVNTPMGLPVPLMGLFNLFQFGEIGEEKQTIAEIVQEMYYEGYDFRHFCSMSIPMVVTETITRVGYALKEIKAGKSIKEAVAFTTNREKHPKIGTMLFLAHSIEVAVNAGKVYFTKNPTAINYPQWTAFAKYSFQQMKWVFINKPEYRAMYVEDKLMNQLKSAYEEIECSYEWVSDKFNIIFSEE